MEEHIMKQTPYLRLTLPLALSALVIAGVAGSAIGEVEPISAEPLTGRNAFSGAVSMQITQDIDGLPPQVIELDDASTVSTVRFTIQPGAVFPWHTHPGTVLISVAEGDFVFVFADDCVAREYSAGGALVDPGNTVHTAYNPSEDTETVVMATLLGAPAEGPATIPVDEAEGAALDEECGIDRDDIASAHSAH
jgi:quercetin dioxygenase-like cupin family protein